MHRRLMQRNKNNSSWRQSSLHPLMTQQCYRHFIRVETDSNRYFKKRGGQGGASFRRRAPLCCKATCSLSLPLTAPPSCITYPRQPTFITSLDARSITSGHHQIYFPPDYSLVQYFSHNESEPHSTSLLPSSRPG